MANIGTLCTVSGDVETPGTLSAVGGTVKFTLNKWDVEAGQIIVSVEQSALVQADGTVSIDLWRNVNGDRGSWYQVTFIAVGGSVATSLGQINVPDAATADLNVLLADFAIAEGVTPTMVQRAETAYQAILAAKLATSRRQVFTAFEGQTEFIVTGGYDPNNVDVWLEGVKLSSPSDVDLSTGTAVTLTQPAIADQRLEVISLGSYVPADVYGKIEIDAFRAVQIQRRRYVSVLDYVPADDTLDCHAGVQAALDEGYGREIVFDNPHASTRVYRFLDRSLGRLLLPRKARIIWNHGAEMDFSAWGKSGTPHPFLYAATGTTNITLTSTAVEDTRTIQLPAGMGATFERGQIFILNSTELFSPMDQDLGTIGEWLEVADVNGDVITTTTALRSTYDPALGTVRIHRSDEWVDLSFENPQIKGPGIFTAENAQGDRGIEVVGAKRVICNHGEILDSDAYSILINSAMIAKVNNLSARKFEQSPVGSSRNRYNVALAGCTSIARVTGCDLTGGTELIALTVSGGMTGLKAHVQIGSNRLSGAERSGVATHHAYRDLSIVENEIYDCNQGADMRLGGVFNDNIVKHTGAFTTNLDCAVQIGSGAGSLSANGNYFEDCLRGYWMPTFAHWRTPADIKITGDKMQHMRAYGVLLDYDDGGSGGAHDATLGRLTVHADIHLADTGAPAAVRTHGRWKSPDINVTVTGGSAAARTVFMTRPESSVGADGPINPIIETRREAPIQASVVQYPVNDVASVKITDQVFGV